MKLLHTVRSLRSETGGLAETVRNLALVQRNRGDDVSIASLDPADEHATIPGVIVLGRQTHGYGRSPQFSRWLRGQAHSFDAVVVHGLWQYQTLGTWTALRGSKTPYVVFCHGMLDPWFKRAYPRKHLKKWLYWPWADYRVLRDAAAVCFTAEEERAAARESFWLYRAKEHVCPIGIPEPPGDAEQQRKAFLKAYPALRGRDFILFLGRIHPKKGVDLLLRAYARTDTNSRELVIVGPSSDASYLAEMKRLAEELKVAQHVHWISHLQGDVKWGALRACEVFALFSHQENFGVAVVEAMACGRAVLLSNRINIYREIAADGGGIVVEDTEDGATTALARWARISPSERARMSEAARACFQRRYEIGSAADALQSLLQRVCLSPT